MTPAEAVDRIRAANRWLLAIIAATLLGLVLILAGSAGSPATVLGVVLVACAAAGILAACFRALLR